MSPHPVPTLCHLNGTRDWFTSVPRCCSPVSTSSFFVGRFRVYVSCARLRPAAMTEAVSPCVYLIFALALCLRASRASQRCGPLIPRPRRALFCLALDGAAVKVPRARDCPFRPRSTTMSQIDFDGAGAERCSAGRKVLLAEGACGGRRHKMLCFDADWRVNDRD